MKTTMNSRISLQLKFFVFVQSLFAFSLTAPSVASTAINIKDTNYQIPKDAYFVSPNGKATNSGKTPDSPWTVTKAIESAPSGATIVFRGGTYRNGSTKITKKLTLQPYPHEKVWLKGSVEVKDWVAEGGIWRKNGWTYSFPRNLSGIYFDPKYPMAGHRDMVYIDGVSLKQVISKAAVGPGRFYVDSINKVLYIGNNPANKTVEATTEEKAAFIIVKRASSNASETVVRGLGFAHYADSAVRVLAPRVTLENNTFVWNGVQGVSFSGESPSTDGIVRGNTFSYNGRKGLAANQAHRMLLEGNTISYNNVERFRIEWDAAGVKFIKTDDLTIRNNLVEHNFADGIWVDASSTNAKIVHNISRYNDIIGIYFELSHKAIIASNLAYNNAVGIMVSNTSSARVYNNTLAKNDYNLYVKDTKNKNTNRQEIAAGITWITRNNVFKNNILSNANINFLEASNCETKEPSKLMIAAANHNAYYRKSSTQPQSIIQWSLGSDKCSVGYGSVAAFKSATGYEAQSLVIENVATNPFFVDEANGNYNLKQGSPAIGRGEPLPPDIASAIGVAPGEPVDMGALQKIVLSQ
jgi:parallel beta-helix repeat protein